MEKSSKNLNIPFILIISNKINKSNSYILKNKKSSKVELVIYLFLIQLIPFLSKENIKNIFYSKLGNITIKIDKAGERIYFYRDNSLVSCGETGSAPKPSNIYINGAKYTGNKAYYDFNTTNNTVILNYAYRVESTKCMFSSCSNITAMDLSEFTTAYVEDMMSMFSGCSSLTSLNLAKFATVGISGLSKLNYALAGCTSLEYINLEGCNILAKNYFRLFGDLTSEKLIICGVTNDELKPSSSCDFAINCNNNNVEIQNSVSNCYKKCSNETELNYCIKGCGINYIEINDASNRNTNIINCYYKDSEKSTIIIENPEVSTIITENPEVSTIITENPKISTIITENSRV